MLPLKSKKILVIYLLMIIVMLLGFTACISSDAKAHETQASSCQDVKVGHFTYSVPDYCEVKDTESQMQIGEDKTVVGDGYVIRSYCVSEVTVGLEAAVRALYSDDELKYKEIGKDNTPAYLVTMLSANTDGKPMYIYAYHFMSEDVMHVFGVWSYTEELSAEALNIIDTIEKTDLTVEEERRRVYEEDLERQHQRAMEEYYENLEPSYEYEPEPYEPPAGAWR